MKIKLSDIISNPFRDLVRNPLIPEKIEELSASIKDTGFWNNVVVRPSPKVKGKWECAYGHHRLEAARQQGITEADFIVENHSDEMMLKIMARENRDEYKATILSMIEAVEATVKALADGKIPAFDIDPKTNKSTLRYAPSFLVCAFESNMDAHVRYTASSLADFLGYTKKNREGVRADKNVIAALNYLELAEQKILTNKALITQRKRGNVRDEVSADELFEDTSRIKASQREQKLRDMEDQKAAKAIRDIAIAEEKRRKEAEDADKAEAERTRKILADAKREEDDKKAAEAAANLREFDKRQQKREEANKASRVLLDAKIKEDQDRRDTARVADKNQATTRDVNDVLQKLKTVVSESNPFRESLKALARDTNLTTNQRELLRQAMCAAGEWYTYWGNQCFLPPQPKDVLAEARSKEEARWKAKEEPCELVQN